MPTTIAPIIAAGAKLTLGYAESLLKEIPPQRMARFAAPGGQVVKSNHPVFVYGHLGIYPTRLAQFIGKPALVPANPPGWEDLFKNGVECVDDPAGTIYPAHEAVVKHFFAGYNAVLAVLGEIDDAIFAQPNPAGGRMAERMPTIGAGVNFLMAAHIQMHLGQLSAWRRMMGLPAAV